MADSCMQYRIMRKTDVEEVIRLVDEGFSKEETVAKSLNFETPKETKAYYDTFIPLCLESQLSCVAIDTSMSQISGVNFNIICTPEKPNEFLFDAAEENSKKLSTMDKVYDPLYEGINFYELYSTSILAANRGLCVSKSHRRKGIAMRLLREALNLIGQRGIPCYVVEATSVYTRKLVERLGFDKVSEKPYTELLVNGVQIVTDTSVHASLSLHAKRL